MHRRIRTLIFLLTASALVFTSMSGCEDGTDPCEAAGGTIELGDENNYEFNGTLDIHSYDVTEAVYPCEDPDNEVCDLQICWDQITEDLQVHAMDPAADIDMVSLVVFQHLTQEEVEIGLSENSLQQVDMTLFVNNTDFGDDTCINLSELTLFGTDIDVEQYFNASYGATWLFTLNTGTVPAVGTRMAAFLNPTSSAVADQLALDNTSTVLDFTVDLTSLTEVSVQAGVPLTADWSALTTSGLGIDFTPGDVNQMMLGYYETLTPEDLESQFLDVELIADELWTMDLETVSNADLAGLTGDTTFAGITTTGTWLLAMRCTTCPNPAPPFLTILEACE